MGASRVQRHWTVSRSGHYLTESLPPRALMVKFSPRIEFPNLVQRGGDITGLLEPSRAVRYPRVLIHCGDSPSFADQSRSEVRSGCRDVALPWLPWRNVLRRSTISKRPQQISAVVSL